MKNLAHCFVLAHAYLVVAKEQGRHKREQNFMSELKVTLFHWLVLSNSLPCLEEQCDVASRSVDLQQRVYRLVLPLDVAELLDYNGMF